MFSKTHEEYKINLEKARELCDEKEIEQIYNRFVNSSQKYCLSQTPLIFHGISLSTSFGEKVNDIFKEFMPREHPFKVVIKSISIIM